MIKKIVASLLVVIMALSIVGCNGTAEKGIINTDTSSEKSEESLLPNYPEQKFEISGFWAPYEISEESFKQYKDAGFTTLNMINHSLSNTSEDQFYLGSKRTMKALEVCKKLGLKAILNYNDWKAEQCEGVGYNGETPFSKYDLYGDYKDIITGVHICDEPSKRHYDGMCNSSVLMDDFKKVYPNANYIVNLSPKHAGGTYWGFADYDELVNTYEQEVMRHLDNAFISVDFYPFVKEEHHAYPRYDDWVITYEIIANLGKKYDAYKTAIIQSSVTNEFAKELSEADMRLQVNMALAFGFDHLQYYCYSVPKSFNEDGTVNYMYEHCILNQDDTPNESYYWLQDIHKEIQSFSNVILAYEWDSVYGFNPVGFSTNMDMSYLLLEKEFKDDKYITNVLSSTDVVMSRFVSEEYGQAYMLVNYAQRDAKNNVVTLTFKDCKKVAVYGGKGFSGTPKIIELDAENKCRFEFEYGEGAFIVPIV